MGTDGLHGKPGFDQGRDFGQVSVAGKHRGDGLALNFGQFAQFRYQLLELQVIHGNPLSRERNENIRASTRDVNSAMRKHI